jgi:hypothetical protein
VPAELLLLLTIAAAPVPLQGKIVALDPRYLSRSESADLLSKIASASPRSPDLWPVKLVLNSASPILLSLREITAVGFPRNQMTVQTDLSVFSTVIVSILVPDLLMSVILPVLLLLLLKMNVLVWMTVRVVLQSDMSDHFRLLYRIVLLIVRQLILRLVQPP